MGLNYKYLKVKGQLIILEDIVSVTKYICNPTLKAAWSGYMMRRFNTMEEFKESDYADCEETVIDVKYVLSDIKLVFTLEEKEDAEKCFNFLKQLEITDYIELKDIKNES